MSLEIPICVFDARTGLLCSVCQAKAKSGQISEADIETSKALATLAGRFRGLESVSLIRSYKVDGDYLLEVRDLCLHALRDKTVRVELERILGGRLWVARAQASNKQLIEDLVHPLRLFGLSRVWLPDGSALTKVVIENAGRGMSKRLETARKILRATRGIDLVLKFDGVPYAENRQRFDTGSRTPFDAPPSQKLAPGAQGKALNNPVGAAR